MRLADDPDLEVDLTPNAFECPEDQEMFGLGAGEHWDEDDTVCPYDAGHYVGPYLVTDTIPDGVPADVARDYWHPTNRRYQFRLDHDD